MKTASTIPGVLNYLVARCVGLMPDVKVTDGQPQPPEDSEPDLLCIGFTGTVGEPAVENTRSRQQMDTRPDRETFEITCLSSSWRGNDTDPQLVRDAAFDIVNRIAELLASDQTLGSSQVMKSRIVTDAVAQEQTTMGAVATIRFVIQVDAYTR